MEKNLKIVIADDSTEFAKNCAKILTSYGMNVVLTEKDGLKVVSTVRKEKPDVLIADVFMPNIDILGVLDEMSKIDKKSRPIVMAISSYANPRLEKEILEAGAIYYFIKPIDINMMAERIIKLSGWRNEDAPLKIENNTLSDRDLEVMITDIIHQRS